MTFIEFLKKLRDDDNGNKCAVKKASLTTHIALKVHLQGCAGYKISI